jgi:DNA polymerase-3 subunit epsilon
MDAPEAAGLPRDLCFVDLETTGANAAYHRITEVGIVRLRDGMLVEEWSSLVNPECRIPAYIESFTGISNEMVATAPRFAELAAAVRSRLEGAVFVAHNARFDYSFLRAEFRRSNVAFSAPVLCTVKLSRRLFPEQQRHNLDALMQRHALRCTARHRALGDARVLYDLWCKLRRDRPEAELAAAVAGILGHTLLPAQLDPQLADDLPEGPGVYRFFGADDALLYVGKSVSLRTRVLGHFAASTRAAKEQKLARQVRRVDWLETAGELGALLAEAHWIKTQGPLLNRRLKGREEAVTIRLPDAASAAPPVGLCCVSLDGVDRVGLEECFGLFRSRKDARRALTDIARARQLCCKLLGLEQAEGSCFAYQLGKCRGACVGLESAALHGLRVRLALASLKLKTWPFNGRIALREARDGLTELHVLDPWGYVGTARSESEFAELAAAPRVGFDADVYRILVRQFATGRPLEHVAVDGAPGSPTIRARLA